MKNQNRQNQKLQSYMIISVLMLLTACSVLSCSGGFLDDNNNTEQIELTVFDKTRTIDTLR